MTVTPSPVSVRSAPSLSTTNAGTVISITVSPATLEAARPARPNITPITEAVWHVFLTAIPAHLEPVAPIVPQVIRSTLLVPAHQPATITVQLWWEAPILQTLPILQQWPSVLQAAKNVPTTRSQPTSTALSLKMVTLSTLQDRSFDASIPVSPVPAPIMPSAPPAMVLQLSSEEPAKVAQTPTLRPVRSMSTMQLLASLGILTLLECASNAPIIAPPAEWLVLVDATMVRAIKAM